MNLAVKNMVCPRCVEAVEKIVQECNIKNSTITLGRIHLNGEISPEQIEALDQKLSDRGFELISDHKSKLINQIRIELIRYLELIESQNETELLSEFLQRRLQYNYSYLSKLFSEKEGKTIESQLIRLKIERVKELLDLQNWTLSEIAWKLNYSSVQYLSNQFKHITGKTVTQYVGSNGSERVPIDQV